MYVDNFLPEMDLLIGEQAYCFHRQAVVTVTKIRNEWPWGRRADGGKRNGLAPILNGDLLVACMMDSVADVAERYGLHHASVRNYRRSIEAVWRSACRQRHSRQMRARTVSDETRDGHRRAVDVRRDQVRCLAEEGLTNQEIADETGLSRTTVWRLGRT